MSRMLCIDHGLKLWGSERALLATLPALAQANEHFVLLAPEGAELVDAAQRAGIVVETGPLGHLNTSARWQRGAAALRIIQLCLKHRINKIYINQAGLCRIAHAIARFLGVPLVIHIRLLEDVARVAALKATKRSPVDLIFISDAMRSRYVEIGGGSKRLKTVYDAFPVVPRVEYDHSSKASSFVCVGRISETKGQVRLVEAVSILHARGTCVHLDIIGAAPEGDKYFLLLKEKIAPLPDQKMVRLIGYRKDAAELISGYNYLVLPSKYEPLGRVVMEAWQAGAIPIASEHSGGCAEIIGKSGGGVLYKGHDPLDIALAMEAAIALSSASRASLLSSGRRWALAQLSVDHYCFQLKDFLFPLGDFEAKPFVFTETAS